MNQIQRAWWRFWLAPVDARRVELVRRGLGIVLIAYFISWGLHIDEWLTAGGFHPSPEADHRNAPRLPLLPRAMAAPLGLTYLAVAIAWLSGRLRPWSSWIVWAGVVYVTAADPISAFTINRLYVITLFILAIAPQRATGTMPGWPLRMLQVLLLTHYAASGMCKMLHGDWLRHADVLWTQVQGVYMTNAAAWSIRTFPPEVWTLMQHAALGFEVTAPVLFTIRRLRAPTLIFGLLFHIIIAVTMYKLIYFSAQMVALYLAFVPAAWIWPRRADDRADEASR